FQASPEGFVRAVLNIGIVLRSAQNASDQGLHLRSTCGQSVHDKARAMRRVALGSVGEEGCPERPRQAPLPSPQGCRLFQDLRRWTATLPRPRKKKWRSKEATGLGRREV